MNPASESVFGQSGQAAHWYGFTQTDPNVLVPFAGYLVAVFVIAVLAHRHRRTASFESEYYVAGRGLGAWVLALSWVATMFSGGAFIDYPSLIYSYGWTVAFWVSGSIVTALVGLGIAGKRINRLARQTGALTLVDLLRDRFRSNAVGILCIVVIIPPTLVYLIAQFAAGTRVLQAMLGTTYPTGLVLFTLSVVAYTTYGGFRAVAWTDTLQGIVMIAGILVLVPLAVSAAGGIEAATRQLATRDDPVAMDRGLQPAPHSYLYGPGPEKVVATDTGAPPEEAPQPLVIHYGGAVTAALFWPGIATLFWKRATRVGVIGGLAGGPLVYLACVVSPPLGEVLPMHPFVYGFFGSAVAVYLGSILTTPQDRVQLTRYFGIDPRG